jgi:hypothetical protein
MTARRLLVINLSDVAAHISMTGRAIRYDIDTI